MSTLDIHGYGTPTAEQDRAVDNLSRFRAAGGRVLYGTDLGNGPLPPVLKLRELQLLAALTDPWPFAEAPSAILTEAPDGPEPLLDRLAGARVVRLEGA